MRHPDRADVRRHELAFHAEPRGERLRPRAITSTALTKLYLDRLERHDPQLQCVVTLTRDLALEQAAIADS